MAKRPRVAADTGERARFTTYLSKTLAERYRDASFWLRVPLVDLIETALARDLERLEKKHGRFKARERDLSPGRAGQAGRS